MAVASSEDALLPSTTTTCDSSHNEETVCVSNNTPDNDSTSRESSSPHPPNQSAGSSGDENEEVGDFYAEYNDNDDEESYDEEEEGGDVDADYYGNDQDEDEDEDGSYNLKMNVWGKSQRILDDLEEQLMPILSATEEYMITIVFVDPIYEQVKYECRNDSRDCSRWASTGECETNRSYMVKHCSPACRTCDDYMLHYFNPEEDEEGDDHEGPEKQEEAGDIRPIEWGVPQQLGTEGPDQVEKLMKETYRYMLDTVYTSPDYEEVFEECENRHADCSFWATRGLCTDTDEKDWMQLYCAPACQSCQQLDFDVRCPVDHNATRSFQKPGDLNAMFERIVTDPYWADNHGPIKILSSPSTTDGPWVVTLDNFVKPEECDRFISIATEVGYEMSEDSSDELGFGGSSGSEPSEDRTSTNAWCPDSCQTDTIVGPVHERIEQLTGTHYNFSEWYQLLRYEPGQFYGEHHDYILHEWERPWGPRVLTVFLYLNDVEEGGGTHFGRLGLTITPKKGRAVIWPSVLDEDPLEWDERTHHEALEVTAGMKYGANAWIHLRDFKTQARNDCV